MFYFCNFSGSFKAQPTVRIAHMNDKRIPSSEYQAPIAGKRLA